MTQRATTQNLSSRCYVHTAKEIGFGYENVIFTFKVFDDGGATITRTLKVKAYRKVSRLNHYLLAPKIRVPLTSDTQVVIKTTKSPAPSTEILVTEQLSPGETRRVILLDINQSLTKGELLEYSIVETLKPGSVALLSSLLEPGETDNRFSFDIGWPTRHLRVEVLLPPQYAPRDIDADVWRGPSRISVEEVARVQRNNLQKKPLVQENGKSLYRLWLDVKYPPQGFVYALKWSPPHSPTEVPFVADDLDTDGSSDGIERVSARLKHLKQQRTELNLRYETLSKRIAALDIDIARATGVADRQPKEEERDDLIKSREDVVSKMHDIETLLNQ